MADAPDSKSGDGNIVRVQVPPPAPQRRSQCGIFFIAFPASITAENEKRMQSLPARILFLLFLLFDADELVVLVFDGLLDISVCDCLAHGEDGSTLFVGYFSAVYTVQCFELS